MQTAEKVEQHKRLGGLNREDVTWVGLKKKTEKRDACNVGACQELMTLTDRKIPSVPAAARLSAADMSDIQAANSLQLLTSVAPVDLAALTPALTPSSAPSWMSPWSMALLWSRDRRLIAWSTYIQFASDRKTRPTVDDYSPSPVMMTMMQTMPMMMVEMDGMWCAGLI